MRTITTTNFSSLTLARRGKVRDVYEVGEHLLIVATDRISAFDVVLPTPIPDKGRVLTQLSCFWFAQTSHLARNHLVTADVAHYPPALARFAAELEGRSMLVRRARPLPVECIVRGYLAGSGWAEYRRSGTVCGIEFPRGLVEADQLPEPLFTPSTKAEGGAHDENIPFTEMVRLVGEPLASRVRDASIAMYRHAAAFAEARGIIIADTKSSSASPIPGGSSCSSTRRSRPTPHASGPGASTAPARRRPASTSNTSGTTSIPSGGIDARRRRSCRRRSSRTPGLAMRRRSNG